ncbi:MAG: hypothetical protein BWX98_01732 [Candidatus Aminicenantes bacterium ADurb.Bin147]|nr:MAG: hypothetical protein BWX98_01732 [Candidatus Aminicenantes bacterium ADurb.Bin147]
MGKRRWGRASVNLSLLVLFFLVASAFTLGRIGTHLREFPLLGSDAANIASFAAARDHPALFADDALLKDPKNIAFYRTLHIPLIRLLSRVFGDYGSAFALLLLPTTLLHLVGYYVLGKAAFQNKAIALFFTLAAAVPIKISLVEWGFMRDVVPRFLFQALLPFVLAAFIKRGRNPKSWPWIMGGVGALVYVHPVSFPAWGSALALSLWVYTPEIPARSKIRPWLGAVFMMILIAAPFAVHYLAATDFGSSSGGNQEAVRMIMEKRFAAGYMDIGSGLRKIAGDAVFSHGLNLGLWILAAAGGIALALRRNRIRSPLPRVMAAWWAAIIAVGVLIPAADHVLSTSLNRTPLEIDLIRSLRYLFPLLLLTAFFLFAAMRTAAADIKRARLRPWLRAGAVLLAAGVMLAWMARCRLIENPEFRQTARCLESGRIIGPFPDEDRLDRRIGLLQALRSLTPPGSRILCSRVEDLAVRYFSLRPLAFAHKDGGALSYANHEELLTWWRRWQGFARVRRIKDRGLYLEALAAYAREIRADYLIVPEAFDSATRYPDGWLNIYSNPDSSIFINAVAVLHYSRL